MAVEWLPQFVSTVVVTGVTGLMGWLMRNTLDGFREEQREQGRKIDGVKDAVGAQRGEHEVLKQRVGQVEARLDAHESYCHSKPVSRRKR